MVTTGSVKLKANKIQVQNKAECYTLSVLSAMVYILLLYIYFSVTAVSRTDPIASHPHVICELHIESPGRSFGE